MNKEVAERLALFATLQATFSDAHPYLDQVVQNGPDAVGKSLPGSQGRRHCARHCVSYSLGQLVAAGVVTRSLGYRPPLVRLMAVTAANGLTHYVIDRRVPLKRFLDSVWARRLRLVGTDKSGYVAFASVQRGNGVVDASGPGTALMEIDQAVHRILGLVASLVMTWVALRAPKQPQSL